MDNNYIIQLIAKLDGSKTADDLKKIEQQLNAKGINLKTSLDTATSKQELQNLAKQLQSVLKANKMEIDTSKIMSAFNQVSREAEKLTSKANKIQLSTDVTKLTTDYQKFGVVSQEVENNLKELKLAQEAVINAKGTDRLTTEIENYDTALDKAKSSLKELTTTQVSMNQRTSQLTSMQEWMRKNKAATKLVGNEVNKLIEECKTCDAVRFNGIKNEFKELQVEAGKAGKLGNSLFGSLKDQFSKFAQWVGVSGLVMEGIQQGKKAVDFAIQLDDALTDVNYTSNVSAKQLEGLGNSAIDMADDLNTSAENILEAVKIYSTANSTAEDIMRKSKPAIMLSNISGMSGSESAKTINTSLNQFELEDTEENLLDITDTLQYVSSQLNYDFTEGIKEITEGIEASGNVAKNAGLNMQEYATMVGIAIEKTGQSGSTIGNAYKTIFSRITKASATEGTLEEDISAAEKSLRSIGVEVRNSEDEFRDLTDIMADLGKVWGSLSSVEKSNVGFQVAGTRQLNVLNSLMGSWDDYSSIIEGIDERSGETIKNQEIYADSLKGHLGDLEATAQSVWSNLIESQTVKSGIDLLTGLLNIVDKTTDALGGLGTVGLGAGIFAGIKNIGKTYKCTDFKIIC